MSHDYVVVVAYYDIEYLQLKENENEIDKLLKEVAVLRYFFDHACC